MKIQILGLLVALLLSPAVVLAEPPAATRGGSAKAVKMAAAAKRALKGKKYDEAVSLARKAVDAEPGNESHRDLLSVARCERAASDIDEHPAFAQAMLEQEESQIDGAPKMRRARACVAKHLRRARAAVEKLLPRGPKPGHGKCEERTPRMVNRQVERTILPGLVTNLKPGETWGGYRLEADGSWSRLGEGVPDGVEIHCWPDGNWKSYSSWKQGEAHGWFVEFHDNGQKYRETLVLDGQLAGTFRAWFASGQLNQEHTFDKATPGGKPRAHGLERAWNEQGRPLMDGRFRHGITCGSWKCRDDAGASPIPCDVDLSDPQVAPGCKLVPTGMQCPPCD